MENGSEKYIEILKTNFPHQFNLRGLKIAIDCANGAAYKVGPQLFRSLGAVVYEIGTSPNGFNINDKCGSTFPNKIRYAVRKHKAHIGISLDGDADRIIMCDEKSNIIDGDQIIAALATRWKIKKMLKGGVVGTLMSNYGLEKYFKSEGIKFYDSRDEMKEFPNHYKKLEELIWTYSKDFPMPEGIKNTRMPFEQAMKLQIDFEENCYGVEIVAVKNEQYIGSTDIEVLPKAEPHKGWTGGLGVLREFRRKGIATAMKIKAIEVLLKKGVTEIRTDNEENNPMYKINVELGFKPVPFSLDYMKKIN